MDERAQRALAQASAELEGLLRAFHASTGCHAALWSAAHAGAVPTRRAGSRREPGLAPPDPFPGVGAPPVAEARTRDGEVRVATLPGVSRAWLVVGPADEGARALDAHVALLAPTIARLVQAFVETEQAARELTERYEEINLLYTISEILGRAVTLEETAATILTEISETVGARRAAILVHDRVTGTLQAVAALGADVDEVAPIAVDDPTSVAARVFRTLHPTIVEADEVGSPGESAWRAGALLSVPIVWSTREGGEPLGVVNLSGRRTGSFTAGDLKLVTAIASQIAAAIQNARLVRASLQQQRFAQEMALAHDLQMRLLPRVAAAAPHAHVAARVVPAESVGGDFFHLFDLGEGRTGVMIGDVSSHGYRAALIMALAMSATAIHARATGDPAETLAAVLASVGEELESTEMFISTFYAVVDPRRGELRYANAGHPHAFVVDGAGDVERLPAGAPPLGMVPVTPAAAVRPWTPERDLLVLFTDGISDACDRAGVPLGEAPVLDVARARRADAPDAIVAAIFDRLEGHTGDVPPRDDLTLLVLRS